MNLDQSTPKVIHGLPLNPKLAEEIARALEMMRRVKVARTAQAEHPPQETPGNTYVLPEPPALRVSGSIQGD